MTTAAVKIWDIIVGAIAWDESRELATFEYHESFSKKGLNISPITMPIEQARNGKRIFSFPSIDRETFFGLPGLLSDSLPDKFGNKLLDTWFAQQGRDPNSFNPIERLCYTGKRGMGALEYEPILSTFKNESNSIEIKELVKLAKEILNERKSLKSNIHTSQNENLLEIIKVGTSAGGARAKAIIAYNPITGDVRSGQMDKLNDYEYWIIKFDGVTNKALGDPRGYGKIEYAYYLMAKDAGINIMESKLLKENRRAHFMTKRFDRIGNEKLHMQTLCALAHFDYNYSSAYSYEQAFQIMRELKLPYSEMEQLLRRMIFNIVSRNQDDHTKNISFLMDKNGAWSLSPAYDITYAYDPSNKWMKAHQMSVNGKRTEINRNDILQLAKNMNLKKAKNIIDEVIESVSKWNQFAKKAELPNSQIKGIGKTLLLKL